MDKLVLDSSVAGQLAHTTVRLPVCDPSGKTLGYFVPTSQRDRELYDWANSLWTDEEVEELSKQTGGVTTEELLERLSKL